jgi:hypothetical protein
MVPRGIADWGKYVAAKKRTPNFHPGGNKGKLHRELAVAAGKKIPASKININW